MNDKPLVSIIIMNWNGKQYLEKCLPTIFESDYENIEVIVADCASRDGSIEFLEDGYPEVRIVKFSKDPGPDYADNFCVRLARGEYVMFLNNDVILPRNTISELVGEITQNKRSVVTPTEKDWNDTITAKGVAYHWVMGAYLMLRPLLKRGWLELSSNGPFYVGVVCSLASKNILLEVPLNEHIIFYEELEWCWRLHLAGVSVKVLDDVYVFHKGSATIGTSVKPAFYSGRSMIASHYVCLGGTSIVVFTPLLLSYYLSKVFLYLSTRRNEHARAFIQGFASFVRDLELFRRDRKMAQRKRNVSDASIVRRMIESCHYSFGNMTLSSLVSIYTHKILTVP